MTRIDAKKKRNHRGKHKDQIKVHTVQETTFEKETLKYYDNLTVTSPREV